MNKKQCESETNRAKGEMLGEKQFGLQEEDRFNILTDFLEAEQEYMDQEGQNNHMFKKAIGELMQICKTETASISRKLEDCEKRSEDIENLAVFLINKGEQFRPMIGSSQSQ